MTVDSDIYTKLQSDQTNNDESHIANRGRDITILYCGLISSVLFCALVGSFVLLFAGNIFSNEYN